MQHCFWYCLSILTHCCYYYIKFVVNWLVSFGYLESFIWISLVFLTFGLGYLMFLAMALIGFFYWINFQNSNFLNYLVCQICFACFIWLDLVFLVCLVTGFIFNYVFHLYFNFLSFNYFLVCFISILALNLNA